MDIEFFSYPRTPDLEDSAIQEGDDPKGMPFSALKAAGVVIAIEEKVDGANAGFQFAGDGQLLAQSRGHYLDVFDKSVYPERHFNLFKDWLQAHEDQFLERFEDRYQVFGEFMGITHSIFYDALPDYFLEFDIYDKTEKKFLDTPSRVALLDGLPIKSVPVLYRGPAISMGHIRSHLGRSFFQTAAWRETMRQACRLVDDDYDKRLEKMDRDDSVEGFYVKVERDGEAVGRYKWVRGGFMQVIASSNEHWQSRFLVPNLLEQQTGIYPAYLVRARTQRPATEPAAKA